MIWLRSALPALGGAAAAGLTVWIWMSGQQAIIVRAEVRAEAIRQRTICDDRVAQVGRKVTEEADKRIADAIAAAREIPEVSEDIKALCKRSASCLSRGKLP